MLKPSLPSHAAPTLAGGTATLPLPLRSAPEIVVSPLRPPAQPELPLWTRVALEATRTAASEPLLRPLWEREEARLVSVLGSARPGRGRRAAEARLALARRVLAAL